MWSVLSFYPLIASVKILCSLFYSSNLLCIFLISISSISALFLCMIKFRRSLASLSWISKVILSLGFHIPVKVKPLGDDWDGICFVTFVKSNAKALLAATPPKMQPAPNGKPFFSGFAPCWEPNFRIQSVKIPLHCTDIFLPSACKSYSNLLEILLLPRKAVLSYSLLILLQSLIFSSFRHFVHYR